MKCFLKIIVIIILSSGLMAISQSCKKKTTIPTLTTVSVSGITQTSATSGGNVTSDGGAEVTVKGVCWGTSTKPAITDSKTSDGMGTGSFTSSLTGLSPNTMYYVRAYATNSEGTSYGNEVSFPTSQIVAATVTTTAATSVMSTTATSGGTISSNGGGDITERGVCWSTAANPTTADNNTSDATGTGTSFTSSITGLLPGTLYHIRAYATNIAGTAYGDDLTFTTLAVVPTVTTTAASAITTTTAISGGNVTANGGATVIANGVCWNTTGTPTISNTHTTDGTGTGVFNSDITGLTANTAYFIRAYATNSAGTGYGNEESIILWLNQPGPSVSDIDGNLYNSVKIGSQIWMIENLKVTKYNNGDSIGTTIPSNYDYSSEINPKYQWAWGGNESNIATYGRLYTWYAVIDNRGVCPAEWHVSTNEDWTILTTYLGGMSIAGDKLKSTSCLHADQSHPTN
jgi:uncharacterized protein (TIGR02145 family)